MSLERIISQSPADTMEAGRSLGNELGVGAVVALIGDLGAGKTHFVKGVAASKGIDPSTVTSPTFTIAQVYSGNPDVAHLDLYRLEDPQELVQTGAVDYIDGDGICLIEWPEKAEDWLPESTVLVRIQHMDDGARQIDIAKPTP